MISSPANVPLRVSFFFFLVAYSLFLSISRCSNNNGRSIIVTRILPRRVRCSRCSRRRETLVVRDYAFKHNVNHVVKKCSLRQTALTRISTTIFVNFLLKILSMMIEFTSRNEDAFQKMRNKQIQKELIHV